VPLADLYLNLMARTLTRFDGVDDYVEVDASTINRPYVRPFVSLANSLLARKGACIARKVPFNAEVRRRGRDWPQHADTMAGLLRLENIKKSLRVILDEDVPGDLVETGVWRGGSSIFMRAALEAYGDATRRVWCADSFEGLPPPEVDRYPQDLGVIWHTQKELAVALEQVQANFRKYGLLDERVIFLKGWFKDTLPSADIPAISLLRLDGDMYASTMDALHALYHKVSPGGFVIVDDYGIPEDTCRRAILDFRSQQGITSPIEDIDGWGVYWRK
jgi:O-methyltransferase